MTQQVTVERGSLKSSLGCFDQVNYEAVEETSESDFMGSEYIYVLIRLRK